MLAFRLARRELRGGVRSLWIVLLCLALGVSVIAAVGSLRAATDRGLVEDGRRILGGDLEVLSGSQPVSDALRDWLRARGARLSEVVQMRSMLVAPTGERQLIELKAVDQDWPLVGEAAITPSSRTPSPTLPASRERGFPNTPSPAKRGRVGEGVWVKRSVRAYRQLSQTTACWPSAWSSTASDSTPEPPFA
jgi:putative ABC transport system permease protein